MNILSTIRGALKGARTNSIRHSASVIRPSSVAPASPLAMASIIRPQVRERWLLPQVGAITPQYIEMTLRGALAGAHIPQWELFNLMEDTWPRLRKNVLERWLPVYSSAAKSKLSIKCTLQVGTSEGPTTIATFSSLTNGILCLPKLHWTPPMTTTPLHTNQKNKFGVIFRSGVGRCGLMGFVVLLGVLAQAVAETNDAGEQLYRRGYPNEVDLEWAVTDYNFVHFSDPVALEYPELKTAEILPALSRAIVETPRKNKRKLARLAVLKKSVMNGRLPKGSILTFQYHNKNRTPYWFQMGTLSEKFSIFLISGMDENPPGESEYNEKAFIIGVLIRSHKRGDDAWKELLQRVAEKTKRKTAH